MSHNLPVLSTESKVTDEQKFRKTLPPNLPMTLQLMMAFDGYLPEALKHLENKIYTKVGPYILVISRLPEKKGQKI